MPQLTIVAGGFNMDDPAELLIFIQGSLFQSALWIRPFLLSLHPCFLHSFRCVLRCLVCGNNEVCAKEPRLQTSALYPSYVIACQYDQEIGSDVT